MVKGTSKQRLQSQQCGRTSTRCWTAVNDVNSFLMNSDSCAGWCRSTPKLDALPFVQNVSHGLVDLCVRQEVSRDTFERNMSEGEGGYFWGKVASSFQPWWHQIHTQDSKSQEHGRIGARRAITCPESSCPVEAGPIRGNAARFPLVRSTALTTRFAELKSAGPSRYDL